MAKGKWGEYAANITFSDEETGLYNHFRALCREVFQYEMGPPQKPGNEARAIRGFIYSRFVAEWLIENGVPPGDKAAIGPRLPEWVMNAGDEGTWVAALQPLCDGEGSASGGSFSVSQSRHTDLDLSLLPQDNRTKRFGRAIGLNWLAKQTVFGIPAIDYCRMTARSELLDDAFALLRRLKLSPKIGITSMFLKDNGFWSANWAIRLSTFDAREILRLGLVTDERKRHRLKMGSRREIPIETFI